MLAAAPAAVERAAILNALTPSVQSHLQQYDAEIALDVSQLRVARGWALVVAEPRRLDGAKIDGRAVFEGMWRHIGGLRVTALLRRDGGTWQFVEQRIGNTGRWYCTEPPAHFPRRSFGC
ncbi:MAG TPA: hypothetical protein VGB70_07660 [Allosphingosinicella sp.]